MAFNITYSEEKNLLLKATRGIGFEEVLVAIRKGGLMADITNPNRIRSHQRVFVVKIGKYVYAVPYVIDAKRNAIFLKTAYLSRVLTRKYIKGDDYDK